MARPAPGDEEPIKLPSPSVFDTAPLEHEDREEAVNVEPLDADQQSPPPSIVNAPAAQQPEPLEYPECERVLLPPIERWDDLSCIRYLNRMYDNGSVDGRGYQILYRMCQTIWAIGHEVTIRKKVKLPRAQRLERFRQLCNAVYQGAKLWQRNMKAKMYNVRRVVVSLPQLDVERPFQDLEPMLNRWHEAMKEMYCPSLEDFKLFSRILEHYRDNYRVLYGLHREKPDYGLRDVFPTADKVFKVLIKLPGYALMADELVREVELNFWRNVDSYNKDRARQREEVAEFDVMCREKKMQEFKQFMRIHQRDFIREVNRPSADPMSQEAFNEHLERFRWQFLNKVADKIKRNEFCTGESNVNEGEFDQIVKLLQHRRDSSEAKKGWIEALGINAEDAPVLYDDDEQEGSDDGIEIDLNSFDIDLFRGPSFLEGGALSQILRGVDQHQWRLSGVIDWTRPYYVKIEPDAALKEMERYYAEKSTKLSHAKLPLVALQKESIPPFREKQIWNPTANMPPTQELSSQGEQQIEQALVFDTSKTECHEATSDRHFHISKSFATIEDDLAVRSHQRSTTVPDTNYVAGDAYVSDSPRPAASFHGRATNTRRQGVQVPRIFTGSFSQLETDIRKLQLDKVKTPEEQPDLSPGLPPVHGSRVHDFAISPRRSPSPIPSPVTLLFRREAFLSKETELQDRVINGEMISTRRPSTKDRAQTVGETTGGLEAWLAKDEARSESPTLAMPALHHSDRKTAL